MTDPTIARLAGILGLEPDSAEFEQKARAIADLVLEKRPASGRYGNLQALERWRRERGGKPVSV